MDAVNAVDLYRFFHTEDAETLALRGVSLQVQPTEMVALLGTSGSGKSTLLACMSGLDEPDGGHVELFGRRLTRQPEAVRAHLRAQSIGILLQNGNLFPALNVRDNIHLAMRIAGRVDAARRDRLLEQLGLTDHAYALPSQLSGGELARAGLAVALANAPRVVMADEPTGEVDAQTEAQIITVLDEQRAAGAAVLIATHSAALAAHATRVVKMRDGRIVHE